MIMRDKIEEAIHVSREPVDQLEGIYRSLDKADHDQFWSIVEDIAVTGNTHERFVALSVIGDYLPPLAEDLVDREIAMIHIDEERDLVAPIITIIREKRLLKRLDFCRRILQYAKDNDDPKLFSYSFRCLLVVSWSEVIDEIRAIIKGSNKDKIVDTLAFFRYHHSSQGWEALLSQLADEEQKKVASLEKAIDHRAHFHYSFLDRLHEA